MTMGFSAHGPAHLSALSLLLAAASGACAFDWDDSRSSPAASEQGDGDSEQDEKITDVNPAAERVVGFWGASTNCGGEFDVSYGLSLCATGKLLGFDHVTYEGVSWYWFDEGTYALSDGALTLHLLRTVVEPEERYGDSSTARLMLEYDPANDQLVVIGADEMPECTGLPLLRLDTVVDADCELDGVGEESP